MKKLGWFFLMLALVSTACNKDDDGASLENTLHYDGDNASGPFLETGYHEAAVRFTSTQTGDYVGKQLIEVSFFMGPTPPQKCEVKIYGAGGDDAPGDELYSADVTSSLKGLDWNDHTLSTPIDITAEDLWISIALTHADGQQSIGCDAGPRQADGDWLFQDVDNDWQTYGQRTSESINWNIRGIVSQ